MTTELVQNIKKHAEYNPVAPALINPAGSTTYIGLLTTIAKIANHFADQDLAPKSRAYINLPNPDLRYMTLLAAIEYGLVPIIASPAAVEANYGYDIVIGGRRLLHRKFPADIRIDESVLGGSGDGRLREYFDREDDDLEFVGETSGTTGTPKLLAVTKAMNATETQLDATFKVDRSSRVMYTFGGSTRFSIQVSNHALKMGSSLSVAPARLLETLKLINLFNITHLVTTPHFMGTAMAAMENRGIKCPSVRFIRLVGATFTRDLIRRIERHFGEECEIHVGYGSSEVGGIATGIVTWDKYRRGFVGKPNPSIEFVSYGTAEDPGQLVVKNNPTLFTRYIVDGEVKKYEEDTYQIPDLGFFDEDGNLVLAGRADEVFNYSGIFKTYNVIQDEIEKIVPVRDVAIVSGSSLGNDMDLIIGLVAQERIDIDKLAAELAKRLRIKAAIQHFRFFQTDSIPRGNMGKVDRKGLIDKFRNNAAPAPQRGAGQRSAPQPRQRATPTN